MSRTRVLDGGDVRVRPARPADAEAVLSLSARLEALHAQLLPDFFRAAPVLDGDAARRAFTGMTTGAPSMVLVAERGRDESIVGMVLVRVYDTPPSPELRPCRRAHIETIVVSPRMRRRGVGRHLLDEAEAWAHRQGAEQVVLTVWEGNTGAEDFYRALGYRPANRVLTRELK